MGVGMVDLVRAVIAFPGLGNVGIVKLDALLSPRGRENLGGEAVKENELLLISRSRAKLLSERVGELGVNEARSVLGLSLTSGAKVETLGGRGRARVPGNPSTDGGRSHSLSCSGDSSAISAIEGLGDGRREPIIVGDSDIRTQLERRWLFRALGLPFRAEGLPDCIGDGSHWNGLPLLLRVEEALEETCDAPWLSSL